MLSKNNWYDETKKSQWYKSLVAKLCHKKRAFDTLTAWLFLNKIGDLTYCDSWRRRSEEAGSKGSSSIKQSRHNAACRRYALLGGLRRRGSPLRRWRRRRRSGPLDVVLPENDVLVDKVAQRSVHGLHAPHVKLPRHCHQPLPRRRHRRRRGRVQYCSERVKPSSRRRRAMLPGYCPTQRHAALRRCTADGFAASGAGCLMSR